MEAWRMVDRLDDEIDKQVEASFIPPPGQEIDMLYELTMGGDMDDIQEYAAHLELLDQKYRPFANKLRELAKDFEDEQILRLVAQYRLKKN